MQSAGDTEGDHHAGHKPKPEDSGPRPRQLEGGVRDGEAGLCGVIDGTTEPHEPAETTTLRPREGVPVSEERVAIKDLGVDHAPL